MATNKKKQDEKHLKLLREMVALPPNKECFDCHQRGPTYINMTTGSFVCTSCSGILRGINPPHRVKSISMASFTPEEIEFLKCHGNGFCQKTWLGLYDARSGPQLESREEQKVKDYMTQKYERKRWYVAPTEAMKEETRRANEAALNKQQPTRPLKSLLGENAPKLQLHQNNQSPKSIRNQTASQPPPVKHIENPQPTLPSPGQQSQTSQKSTGSAAMDLLGDLGSDPFASSAPPGSTNTGDGFGDFGADFSKMNSHPSQTTPSGPPAGAQSVPQPPTTGMPLFASTNTPLQPVGNQPAPVTNGTASTPQSAGDRYAALANLDSVFGVPQQPVVTAAPTHVDWSGGSGGSGFWSGGGGGQSGSSSTLNWNSTGGATPEGSSSGMSWNAGGQSTTSSSQPSMNWNTSATTPVSSNAGFTSAPNPFGGSAPAPATTQVGNPFAGGGQQQMFGGSCQPAAPASNFGQFGTPATNAPSQPQQMFGNQPAAQPQPGGFGQFGMQNGGFGAQPAQPAAFSTGGGFGTSQAPPAFGTTGGFGGAASGNWGQPPATSVNPFMSAATQQQVPPRSNATNPFL